jgi:hypothetical protein
VPSSNPRAFGLDESFPPSDQRWQSSATSTRSPEKSESRLTTGDTGEIFSYISIKITIYYLLGYRSNSASSLRQTKSRASSRTSSRTSTADNS